MGLFEQIWGEKSPEEQARIDAISADIRAHFGQRPCPEGCGCTEFYDDRTPDRVDGGFGVAGCECARCNDDDNEETRDG